MLHGHRYTVEATFESEELDELGMVIDFAVIKEQFNSWLNQNWDHNVILSVEDEILGQKIESITGQEIFYMDANPTAENMAYYLLNHVCPLIFANNKVKCVKIKLYETPNCYVVANA
ncbi:6-carboxy-5,6,7,8-tetrahydropterin synthase [Candidatus Bandiella woodruffii]|uniref:6-carboxy-5,6,7,8-tetrahydropterin synthase n=2 Tax=Candidatus Bandiella euplotis TaxID=1664265 RepID=A0ABZ0ULY7_9RICK|nr:6-carboxy-5,6,7,8-tetrahydropterin synthase [Candidatus Bandiella woodruffii]